MTDVAAGTTEGAPGPPAADEADGSTLAALRLERPGPHVLEIVLTGPGKGNAMGPDVWRELPLMMRLAERDADVRAVLIRGSGAHFSYGLDLGSMLGDIGNASTDDGGLAGARTALLQLIGRLQEAITSVERCTKPVVAAIDGWCIGAGVDLISACDIRVCSASARFSVREVKVGIVADVGSLQRLPYIIGDGMTRRLALTGEDIDAVRAERIGLVSEVLPDGPEALEFARALCGQLAANPPLVVQGTKQVLNETRDLSVAEGLRHVAVWNAAFLPSHDLQEAVRAFMERREPTFEGR